MIPAAFEYHRPTDLKGALDLLLRFGDEARVVAGGHSLVPMMKLRMADIRHLVDLGGVHGLDEIEITPTAIKIGAMVTQYRLINDAALGAAAPILREASLQIADPQVRYMGTLGGNVANGDPGNDMPALMQCLDATYSLDGPDGRREVSARDFYEAAYVTQRADDEILVGVRFAPHAKGYAYEKQKRKIGDYATAAAAVLLTRENGTCTAASIAMTNLSDVPVYTEAAGAALVGTSCETDDIAAAVEAMLSDIQPNEDNRGPVAFKRHVAGVILTRAIKRAWNRA